MKSKKCKWGNIHLVGVPKNKSRIILDCVIKSLDKARSVLKYKKQVNVVIIEAQVFFTIPKLGIGGSAIGKSCIEVRIDFSRKNLQKIIDIELPTTIYHELTHLVRENSVGYGEMLLDSFVSEGISCFVEKSMFPNKKIPYIQKIQNEQKFWHKARRLLEKTKYDYSEWFLGSGKLPKWIGYRLGFLLIQNFIKRSKIPLDKLVRLSSQEILKGNNPV